MASAEAGRVAEKLAPTRVATAVSTPSPTHHLAARGVLLREAVMALPESSSSQRVSRWVSRWVSQQADRRGEPQAGQGFRVESGGIDGGASKGSTAGRDGVVEPVSKQVGAVR
ncbi:hypothetical protein GCM10010428_05350 [Actinosynnema pretiosum subsp. pretiosum]